MLNIKKLMQINDAMLCAIKETDGEAVIACVLGLSMEVHKSLGMKRKPEDYIKSMQNCLDITMQAMDNHHIPSIKRCKASMN